MTIGKNMLGYMKLGGDPTPTPTPAQPQQQAQEPAPAAQQPKQPEPKPAEPAQPSPEPAAQEPQPAAQPDPNKGADPKPAAQPQAAEPAQGPEPTPAPQPELNEEAFLSYIKEKKGFKGESLDELFKKPEPAADPFEGLSDEAVQFVKYNKETQRSYKEFEALNRDYSKVSPLEAAREKALAIGGDYIDQSNVDEYLEAELGIDVSDFENLSAVEKMRLKNFGQDYIQSQIEAQQKYKQPIERPGQPEMVTLENGQTMPKETYDKLVDQQLAYQNSIKEASDKINASAYDIKIDDNGTEKVMNVAYEYSKDDKQDMVSSALNIDAFYQKAFGTEKGLDYAKLEEGLHWADPAKREKSITAIVHKALAQQAEEFAAIEHNAEVKTKQMPHSATQTSNNNIASWRGGNTTTGRIPFKV
tara:strand:- start:1742 stop:2989 length:1248 start_codon:yes stop_codon:yes gene_type:complete